MNKLVRKITTDYMFCSFGSSVRTAGWNWLVGIASYSSLDYRDGQLLPGFRSARSLLVEPKASVFCLPVFALCSSVEHRLGVTARWQFIAKLFHPWEKTVCRLPIGLGQSLCVWACVASCTPYSNTFVQFTEFDSCLCLPANPNPIAFGITLG